MFTSICSTIAQKYTSSHGKVYDSTMFCVNCEREKQEAFVMFYTRWRPSCLTPTRKCRKSLIRGIIDVQNMKLCYVRFGKVGGCISFITRDDHVNDDHDGDDDDDDDGGGHNDWPPSHVGKAFTELDSHESDEYT